MKLAAQNHILYNVLMSQSVAISLSGKKLRGHVPPGAPTVPTPMIIKYEEFMSKNNIGMYTDNVFKTFTL